MKKKQPDNPEFEKEHIPIIEAKLDNILSNIEMYGNKQIFILQKILEELREITKNTFKGH